MTSQCVQHLQTERQTNGVCSNANSNDVSAERQCLLSQFDKLANLPSHAMQVYITASHLHVIAFSEETKLLCSVANDGVLMLQALQAAAASHSADPTDHSAAQHLVACLGKAKDAAEMRPKVWLSLVESQEGVLQALVAGLLSWQMPSALERALQLVMLLLPAPETHKDGLK